MLVRLQKNCSSHTLPWEIQNAIATLKTHLGVSYKVKFTLLRGPRNSTFRYYLREMKT